MSSTRKKPPPPPPEEKESDKPASSKKKPVNDIEEIFKEARARKRKQPVGGEGEAKGEKSVDGLELKKMLKKRKKEKKELVVLESSEDRVRRRRTADGLAIYSAEELGVGNQDAGGTPLCPFDCSCCF